MTARSAQSFPNVTAARLTPVHILTLLDRYPVGTQLQRARWGQDLTKLHESQHYPFEGHKDRFTDIRAELRAARFYFLRFLLFETHQSQRVWRLEKRK